ncbi:hypothetical protein [Komagataeibacter diospyri]|uniref:hypothetical protein n=1 Tax=Komagataeibacter diospyri TaxID=1932662 RepID=UPI0011443F28|nr:hypothetical protein [Komagataeibacter diospyri]
MSREDALHEIKDCICGCYSRVDLNFALHPSDKGRADALRDKSRMWNLNSREIRDAITPVIKNWLTSKFTHYGESKPRPYDENIKKIDGKVNSMVSAAVEYFTR